MVDPLGLNPVPTRDRRVAGVTRIVAPIGAGSVTGQDHVASPPVTTAREIAARPPIDHDRVAKIRQAIADGSFPIYPTTIADRLIALKLEWDPHEPE